MSFQTWNVDPGFPPADGRTRTTIGQWVVDYDPPTAPTLAQVQAQAAPSAAQVVADLRRQAVVLFETEGSVLNVVLRAILLVVAKRLAAQDKVIADFVTDVDLKSRWAALPAVDAASVKQAFADLVNGGGAD